MKLKWGTYNKFCPRCFYRAGHNIQHCPKCGMLTIIYSKDTQITWGQYIDKAPSETEKRNRQSLFDFIRNKYES